MKVLHPKQCSTFGAGDTQCKKLKSVPPLCGMYNTCAHSQWTCISFFLESLRLQGSHPGYTLTLTRTCCPLVNCSWHTLSLIHFLFFQAMTFLGLPSIHFWFFVLVITFLNSIFFTYWHLVDSMPVHLHFQTKRFIENVFAGDFHQLDYFLILSFPSLLLLHFLSLWWHCLTSTGSSSRKPKSATWVVLVVLEGARNGRQPLRQSSTNHFQNW